MESSDGGISLLSILRWQEKQKESEGGGGGGRPKIQLGGGKKRIVWNHSYKSNRVAHSKFSAAKINNIVKVRYVGSGSGAQKHMSNHISYILEREKGKEEPDREFYSRYDSGHSKEEVTEAMMNNRGDDAAMFKIILSPKDNELDHVAYTREIMSRWEDQTGIYTDWYFVPHKNTEHHHVHIVMPGRDLFGSSYQMNQEHLDCFKEIANEHQYELGDRDERWQQEIRREISDGRDDPDALLRFTKDLEIQKDLGLHQPRTDRITKEVLGKEDYFDASKFIKDLGERDDSKAGAAEVPKEVEKISEPKYPSPLDVKYDTKEKENEPEKSAPVKETNRLDDRLFNTIKITPEAPEPQERTPEPKGRDDAGFIYQMQSRTTESFDKDISVERSTDSLSSRGDRDSRSDDDSNMSRGDR